MRGSSTCTIPALPTSLPRPRRAAGDGWQYGGLGFDAGMVLLIVGASVLAFNAVRYDRNIGSARLPEAAVAADEEKARRALASTTRFGLSRGALGATTTRKVPGGGSGSGMVASDSVSSLSGVAGGNGGHTDAELGMDAPSPLPPSDRRPSSTGPPIVAAHAGSGDAVAAAAGTGHVALAIRATGDEGATPAAASAAEGPLSPISPPVATPAANLEVAAAAAAAAEAASSHALAFEPMTL